MSTSKYWLRRTLEGDPVRAERLRRAISNQKVNSWKRLCDVLLDRLVHVEDTQIKEWRALLDTRKRLLSVLKTRVEELDES